MKSLATSCVLIILASVTYAQEQVSPLVEIHGAGLNVESDGSVTYFKTATCGYIVGKHNIVNGNGSITAEVTFGPKEGNFFKTDYQGTVSGPSAYSNCYRANIEATGECGTSQRRTSPQWCAPPQSPPPPNPNPGGGGCFDTCDDTTFNESGAGSDPLVIS